LVGLGVPRPLQVPGVKGAAKGMLLADKHRVAHPDDLQLLRRWGRLPALLLQQNTMFTLAGVAEGGSKPEMD